MLQLLLHLNANLALRGLAVAQDAHALLHFVACTTASNPYASAKYRPRAIRYLDLSSTPTVRWVQWGRRCRTEEAFLF